MSAPGRSVSARPALTALVRTSTTEQALRVLRSAIVSGRISQGEQLREVPLSQSLGIGRSALREALRQLVQEGLVQHEIHRGAFVRVISPADIVDVYLAREAVEAAAVTRILSAGAAVDLAPLRSAFEALREAAADGAGTWQDMAEEDIRFHETLVATGGSARLERMYATLAAESRMHLRSYPAYPALQNVRDHERILVALEHGSEEAEALLREHLRTSARLAVEGRGEAADGS